MNVNISFIKLKNNVTSEYHLTKRNWKSKEVQWNDIHKVMSNSKIQYSCYSWLNGYKNRYGLYRLDLNDMNRTPKASARWYAELIKHCGFN